MTTIWLLAVAIVLFGATHLLPSFPTARARVKARLGRAYLPLFIATSIATTIAVGWWWANSPFIPLYDPPSWGPHVTFTLMLAAFVLFGIFLLPCRLKAKIRNPFAWVILLWGVGHLLANGDLATVVLAGGLMLVAALMLLLARRNDFRPDAAGNPALDIPAVLTGLILYVAMAAFHHVLIGAPILHYIGW